MNAFGDSNYAAWFQEVIQDCLIEVSDNKTAVDLNLLVSKFASNAEFKAGQVTLQLLAKDLREELNGRHVSQATGDALNLRLLIGSVYLAYCIARRTERPEELNQITEWNPVIVDCAEFVCGDQIRHDPNWLARFRIV